jgi:hypothetical protein
MLYRFGIMSGMVRKKATGSLIYLVHIFGHFLSAVLLHRNWLNQRAGCTRAVAEMLLLSAVVDSLQWQWAVVYLPTIRMRNTDPARNVVNCDGSFLMSQFQTRQRLTNTCNGLEQTRSILDRKRARRR